MPKRQLHIVKTTPPMLGVCERCNSRFRSNAFDSDTAHSEIRYAFGSHKCCPNALRVIDEATKGK